MGRPRNPANEGKPRTFTIKFESTEEEETVVRKLREWYGEPTASAAKLMARKLKDST